jgi:hypothetical protein
MKKLFMELVFDLVLAGIWMFGCLIPYNITHFNTVLTRATFGIGSLLFVILSFCGVCYLKFKVMGKPTYHV